MKKTTFFVLSLFGILMLGVTVLHAAETGKQTNAFKQILDVQGRGVVNILTFPGEFGRAFRIEKKAHPKAWPVTYFPRALTDAITRAGSGVHDVAVLPFYVNAIKDPTPMTRHFELPDYCWQQE
jgi:hypothetical protein